VQRERSPTVVPMVPPREPVQNERLALLAAPNFQTEPQSRPVRRLHLPLNVEAESGTFVRVLPQESLVRVASVQTGGERVAAFVVQEVRKNLDDPGGGGSCVESETRRQDQLQQHLKPAHRVRLRLGRRKLNVDLPVKCLFLSVENETLPPGRLMKTVVLIDDDTSFRKLMGKWLTVAGWNVLEAGD